MIYYSIVYNFQEEFGKGEDDLDSIDVIFCGVCGVGECVVCMVLKAVVQRWED